MFGRFLLRGAGVSLTGAASFAIHDKLFLERSETHSYSSRPSVNFQPFSPYVSYCSELVKVNRKEHDSVELADNDKENDIENIISNGFAIDPLASPSSLDLNTKRKFALRSNGCQWNISPQNFLESAALVKEDSSGLKNNGIDFPAAVFTTPKLLESEECMDWIQRAESINFEEGDFIFKTGKKGYDRMATGGRRNSATMVVTDLKFAQDMASKLRSSGIVPLVLNDGRKFVGVRNSFLVSRYRTGQYFAPHFDGTSLAFDDLSKPVAQAEYVVVLYLTNDFEGEDDAFSSFLILLEFLQ